VCLPEHRKMKFRMGINLGDVIENGATIYGDGVNLAARLESLAEPGGICLSRSAHDQVVDKLGVAFEYLGPQQVENIDRPIRAYRVASEALAKAVERDEESIKTSKPSIAVLPFDNLSGDPSQEYFSDGMTEEIISGLSKIPRIWVIARNSTFTFKGRPVKVQQVGRELGVGYVLEGRVRKSGNRVRITAQLIEAETGHHLWTERWDRELQDIFALQDEITLKIMTALQVKLTEGEQVRVWHEKDHTTNLDAYLLILQGEEYFSQLTAENNTIAKQMFEKAVALDSESAGARVLLAWTYLMESWMGWSKTPAESFAKASELARKASDLNDALDITQALMGMIYLYQREYDLALASAEKAVALSPSGADAHGWLAGILSGCGRQKEALEAMKRAMRLNPLPPGWYYIQLGRIYCFAGKYDRSLHYLEKAREIMPTAVPLLFNLVVTHGLAGNIKEAKAAAAPLLELYPEFSLAQVTEGMPFKEQADIAMIRKAFRRAGFK